MWEKADIQKYLTIEEMLKIIEDALAFGFEFKIENHSLWFREI